MTEVTSQVEGSQIIQKIQIIQKFKPRFLKSGVFFRGDLKKAPRKTGKFMLNAELHGCANNAPISNLCSCNQL